MERAKGPDGGSVGAVGRDTPADPPADIESTIALCRKAVSEGRMKEKELCRSLLKSSDPVRHKEAFEIARRNVDTKWGKAWLFKMYFNGIGTGRNVKKALHVLHSGTPYYKTSNGAKL
jgi:hypothetical protein